MAILVYYVYSAAKLAVKFHDGTAMRLVVLYFVRAFAWISGAVSAAVKFLFGERRKKPT